MKTLTSGQKLDAESVKALLCSPISPGTVRAIQKWRAWGQGIEKLSSHFPDAEVSDILDVISVRHRIMARVVAGANGCWLWTGAKINSGSGHLKVGDKMKLAHRAMYEDCFGPVAPDQKVRHKCDVRACVNPFHLEPGSHGENMNDFKERGVMPIRHKIEPEKRLLIRAALKRGVSISETARTFGVNRGAVRHYKSEGMQQ